MEKEETKYWKFHHLGVIVGDMEKVVNYYRSLGFIYIDPPPPQPPKTGSALRWVEMTSYGKTIVKDGELVVPLKISKSPPNTWCQIGTMTLELIQPAEGLNNVLLDFLKKNGDGINHVGYTVGDGRFEEEIEKMKARGLDIIWSGKWTNNHGDSGGFCFFDTRKYGGILTELMYLP